MKSIWIIYDTKYGNNKFLANSIQSQLQDKFSIKMGKISEVKPKTVIMDKPYGLIIGGPIRFGNPSLAIQRWIKKMGRELKKKTFCPEKADIYCTALGDVEKGNIINRLAVQYQIAKEINQESFGLLVEELKGPFKINEIKKYSEHLDLFFS